MSAWAKVGAKVVCVDDSASWAGRVPLVKGQIYVIQGILPNRPLWGLEANVVGLFLLGVQSRSPAGFRSDRFEPLVEKTQEQDVSMFKSLLNKTPINETA